MPYEIRKIDDKFCVVKRDDNKRMGCHDTREKAQRQIAALYASEHKGVSVMKAADGTRYMALVTSNSYQDREGEWIAAEALKAWTDSKWDGDDYKAGDPLLFWHDGPPIGELVFSDMVGPFLVEVAKERQSALPAIQHYTRALWDYVAQHKTAWGASHGFMFRATDQEVTDDGPVYRAITKVETSVLPLEWAANPYTYAGVILMSDNKARSGLLERLLGPLAAMLGKGVERAVAELEAAGVEHKALEGNVTKADLADVVVFALKQLAEKEVEEGEDVDVRSEVEAAVDALFAVPAVNVTDVADVLDVVTPDEAGPDDEDDDDEPETADEAEKSLDPVLAAIKEQAAEQTKTLAYLGQLVEAQGDVVAAQQAHEKAITTVSDLLQKQDARIKALEDAIAMRPKAASRASETVIPEDDARAKATDQAEKVWFGKYPAAGD